MSTDIFEKLEKILIGKVGILGIGNPLKGDDAFGSLLAERMKGKVSLDVYNGGSSPENLLGKIIQENYDTIIFIDAIDFGGNSGEMELFDAHEVKTSNIFFTHNPSPYLVIDFIRENSQAKVYFLAIQPKSINLGEKISFEIEEKLNLLENWFRERYSLR